MKPRENLVRLKLFKVNEKRRQIEQLDSMMTEFDRIANELDAQIELEEKKSGITDINHFAYPTFAKAARKRRDNLAASRAELQTQRETAEIGLAEAEAELAKAEMLEGRDGKSRNVQVNTVSRSAMIG